LDGSIASCFNRSIRVAAQSRQRRHTQPSEYWFLERLPRRRPYPKEQWVISGFVTGCGKGSVVENQIVFTITNFLTVCHQRETEYFHNLRFKRKNH
jgi:hypothetical protein